MKSRAALLPHPADPFMLAYWLKFFNEVWIDEVDKLYIYVNSPIEKPVIDFMRRLCDLNPKINWQYNNVQTEHGFAIDRMLDIVEEPYVMLIEDDGFIFRKGVVDHYFAMLERSDYDVIGSPRGSCSMEIWEGARVKWGLNYEGLGDVGPNFWPCYFFTAKELLLKTDRNFGARNWPKGSVIPELGISVQEDGCNGDTFVNTSLQIRNMVPKSRILTIPQYHGSPDDVMHYDKRQFLFDGKAPWTHVGSLSSGTHGILTDGQGRSLARRLIDEPVTNARIPGKCDTLQEHNEWERRVQWWLTFWEYSMSVGIPGELAEFADLYKKAIDRIIRQYGLLEGNIKNRQQIYKTLGL